ncbi:DUF998 domain-containing protein [Nocardia seriolae]|uniref:DUF998 domain-containing protein n=1 Tax=Nocardia seriolae TaxID=37332 RepID=UPI0009E06828|nr:DUF998 domain-containing protein [Nocardia seriolae]MTJ65598.1 DUF998 domain-containing protein [Nocardia seriolae]MTJ72755.1 DUF998 domain-containing protein [Nocardia seriolae]MTJ90475.1 DUF998 domain-containing protein [Nocardia seriolae]MTK34435.1 DUF998 domain-containing protein [Nocardia seriolae]MTK43589.1 DUF998 domain-containing protein [Nocardia seriolae]
MTILTRRSPAVGSESGNRHRWRILTAAILAGAGLAYALWLVEFALPTRLSLISSFVSEHYVVSQPYHLLFRGGDVIAGILYTAAAALVAAGRRAGDRLIAGTVAAAALFGMATVTDAVFVPDCLTTVDPECERREFAAQVSWHHLAHLGSSVVSQLAAITVVLALERLATRSCTRIDRVSLRTGLAVVIVAGLACVAGYPFGWVGVPQRIQLVALSTITIGVAWRIAFADGGEILTGRGRRALPVGGADGDDES